MPADQDKTRQIVSWEIEWWNPLDHKNDLDTALAQGWEPFAVTVDPDTGYQRIWIRKPFWGSIDEHP